MYAAQPKKLMIVNILEILKKYSDENHRLSQKEIGELLLRDYGMKADRKAIKRNLTNLLEFGYDIEYSESTRRNRLGEEETVLSDWYLNRDFSDGELRLLIDSLLFSKHIPYSQCRELVDKLKGLSSRYFEAHVRYIRTLPDDQPYNRQLFYTIDVLDEAISKGRQVKFHYLEAGPDHKRHPRRRSDGEIREYLINPYQMAAADGRYYLLCNYDKYDNIVHFRVDRIADIQLLQSPVKPLSQIPDAKNGLNLSRHMAEHIYMFSGCGVKAKFRAQRHLLDDIEDWFGGGAQYSDITDDSLSVTVTVNEDAMFFWAMQFCPYAEVLEPAGLRQRIEAALREAAAKYADHQDGLCRGGKENGTSNG